MRSSAVFLSLTTALSSVPAYAQPAAVLAPHRAVYDLALDKATERSGIVGLQGRMVYEFNGSPCEGYTVNFRFVTKIATRELTKMTDQQSTTFEDGAGKSFNFVTKTFVDQTPDKELRGVALEEPGGLKVDIERPEKKTVELSKTQFPTQHLLEVIGKAERGETFFETNLFDGSDEADKVMTTTVVVGKPETPQANDPEIKADEAVLGKDSYWPVDIAYFDLKKQSEETPQYRISFKLHRNGVTRDLEMDYGDFAMKGTLVNLAMLPAPKPCD